MNIKLPTEHHLECLSLIGGCIGLSVSIHVMEITCHSSYTIFYVHISIVFLSLQIVFILANRADLCLESSLFAKVNFYD